MEENKGTKILARLVKKRFGSGAQGTVNGNKTEMKTISRRTGVSRKHTQSAFFWRAKKVIKTHAHRDSLGRKCCSDVKGL